MISRCAAFSFARFCLLVAMLLLLPVVGLSADIKVWVLLMQNPTDAQTIVSNNPEEKDGLLAAGWRLSGTGLTESEPGVGRGLMHRMVKTGPGFERRLALTAGEVKANEAEGFTSEGAMGHVEFRDGPGYVAVHTFKKAGRYIWVIDHHDQYWADQNGWERVGAVFWLRPVSAN